ncbi:MAG: histidine kinase [Acutalibacteraceae bacterium]|nr:histidine kinase [Acutalibacteraceae bacterium]
MSKSKRMYNILLHIGLLPILTVLLMFVSPCVIAASAARDSTDITTWSSLQEAINNAESGDTITLTSDLTANESDTALIIPDSAVLTLDLNGHTIDRDCKSNRASDGAVISVSSDAVLTVKDSSESSSGKITGGYATNGGGIQNIGTLIMEGGCITGNTAAEDGGGIVNYGVIIVKGGSVIGNTAFAEGGGIYNAVKGYVTAANDSVYGNSAPKDADIRNLGSMKTIGGETVYYTAIMSCMELLSILPVLALLSVLSFVVSLDNYLTRQQKRDMYIITILVFTLVIQNCLDTWLYNAGKWVMLRIIVSIYGYAVRPAILAMFLRLICPERRYRLVWLAVAINAAVYLTALFSPLTFSYPFGHFISGPLNQLCLVLSAVLFIYCIYVTVRVFRPKESKETWIPIFALVLISLSVVMDYTVEYTEQPVSFLTIAITISCMMYYIWLHLQFVRKHERALQAEHRIQIMMTQIQPHFLFNTLTAIRALCIKDPPAAVHTIGLFGAYLRQNLESLNQTEVIPLVKELEHLRVYTEIEIIRFPNIRIEYDIRDKEYCIPALTIQPLVENAIRHGVRSR